MDLEGNLVPEIITLEYFSGGVFLFLVFFLINLSEITSTMESRAKERDFIWPQSADNGSQMSFTKFTVS